MKHTPDQHLRTVRLSPYRRGMGPTFTLTMWDTYKREGERTCIGYRLTMSENSERTVLFQGEDYKPSPMHAIDSDDSVNGLLGFLTLRPGDTDDEYFESYTEAQLAYCSAHAEALLLAALDRFGEL